MKYIVNESNDTAFNIALEEYAFKQMLDEDMIFILWINKPSIILVQNFSTEPRDYSIFSCIGYITSPLQLRLKPPDITFFHVFQFQSGIHPSILINSLCCGWNPPILPVRKDAQACRFSYAASQLSVVVLSDSITTTTSIQVPNFNPEPLVLLVSIFHSEPQAL